MNRQMLIDEINKLVSEYLGFKTTYGCTKRSKEELFSTLANAQLMVELQRKLDTVESGSDEYYQLYWQASDIWLAL